jgi:hypothetical protein
MSDAVLEKCVIVVSDELPPGRAANAAAVVALTLGGLHPRLLGRAVADADGDVHPGLIPQGLPILRAPGRKLAEARNRAQKAGLGVIDFPVAGQEANDYDDYIRRVGQTPGSDLRYCAVAIYGPRREVADVTGRFSLLR